MGRMMENRLFELIHDYLVIYLPKQCSASENTIKSYKMILNQLLDYITVSKKVSLKQITFETVTRTVIADYLAWLSEKNGCCDSTCNQHLAGVRSFYSYAASVEPIAVKYYNEVMKVPLRKLQKKIVVDHMTEEAVQAILNQPDQKKEKGIRDLFLMILLYDTGARIQEILNSKIKDIQDGKSPQMILLGKGNKLRIVPLMEKTIQHFYIYCSVFHPDETYNPQDLLFYTVRHGRKGKMSDDAVQKFMKKYAAEARKSCAAVPDNVYPHLWRHSRAMHLYQHGMDLTLISQWLGHSQLETTLIYAHADTELKRQAIEKAMGNTEYKGYQAERYQIDDEQLIKKLYGLK